MVLASLRPSHSAAIDGATIWACLFGHNHGVGSSYAHTIAQLACSNGANATGSSSPVSFSTGATQSDVPTFNMSGPVTCLLTLSATDALGQTRTATTNITVSARIEQEASPRGRLCPAHARAECLHVTSRHQLASSPHLHDDGRAAPLPIGYPAAGACPSHHQQHAECGCTQQRVGRLERRQLHRRPMRLCLDGGWRQTCQLQGECQ